MLLFTKGDKSSAIPRIAKIFWVRKPPGPQTLELYKTLFKSGSEIFPVLVWEKNGIVSEKSKGQKAPDAHLTDAARHSKTITIYDFEGLLPDVQKEVLKKLKLENHASEEYQVADTLRKTVLPPLLQMHNINETGYPPSVHFHYKEGKGSAAFSGDLFWGYDNDEGYLIRVRERNDSWNWLFDREHGYTVIEPASVVRLERSFLSDDEIIPYHYPPVYEYGEIFCKFASIFSKTCEKLSEEGKKMMEARTTDEKLKESLKINRSIFLEDGRPIPRLPSDEPLL